MKTRNLVATCAALFAVACTSNAGDVPAPAETSPAATNPGAANPAPAAVEAAPVQQGEPRLTLLLTSDNRGEIAACGCSGNPTGGLARRATIVETSRAEGPTVVIDGGDALFVTAAEPDAQARERASLILAAMGEIGTAAMAVGELDLAAGVDWLRTEAKTAKVPLLAANLVAADGTRPFEASRVIRAGASEVGVVAVWTDGTLPKGWTASDPFAAVTTEAARLREAGVELVVALVHGGTASSNKVSAIDGVDFVLPSHQGSPTLPFQSHPDRGWILGADSRGRVVLRLEVHPVGEGALVDAAGSARKRSERDYVAERVKYARGRLDRLDGEQRKAYAVMVERLEARLAELTAKPEEAVSLEGRRRFALTEERLVEAVAAEARIDARVKEFEKKHGLEGAALAP